MGLAAGIAGFLDRPETVSLDPTRAQLGQIRGSGQHGGKGDGFGEQALLGMFQGTEERRIGGRWRGGRPGGPARFHGDCGITNNPAQFFVEAWQILVGQRANVDESFGFGRNHVEANTGPQHGGRQRRVNHGEVRGFVALEIAVDFRAARGKLGELRVESTSRLANSLGLELVKAEASRAEFERPDNPNAVDLAMRGWATMRGGYNQANLDAAIGYFERALRLDPELTQAKIGLAAGLVNRFGAFRVGNLAVDFPRADALLTSALAAKPNSAWAHLARAELQFQRGRIDEAFSELDVAIENDQNLAAAHGLRGAIRVFLGQAKEGIPEIETALRLSPRDPSRNVWEANICHAYALLEQWEKAVERCTKSIATDATFYFPYVNLVAAYGWLNRGYEAKNAIASLLKLRPSFTVNYAEKLWFSYDPTFEWEEHRILEGLRKAGIPEE